LTNWYEDIAKQSGSILKPGVLVVDASLEMRREGIRYKALRHGHKNRKSKFFFERE